ncbi:MAG: DUF2220 family protein [Deltaproteobacteria bacterium]|jgi:hypothetical protein|nr:DUF2220 family protein [Deltaproteobacteria bacterium]
MADSTSQAMLSPAQVRRKLRKKFDLDKSLWLAQELGIAETESAFPLVVNLRPPREAQIAGDVRRQADPGGVGLGEGGFAQVRRWSDEWRRFQETNPGEVRWRKVVWKILGEQELPEKLVLRDPDEAAHSAGATASWRRMKERAKAMTESWPKMAAAVCARARELDEYSEEDFQKLMSFLRWIVAHPVSDYYLRQLPVPKLDTKWLERRSKLVGDLAAALLDRPSGDIYQVCRLKEKPHNVHLRLLDPAYRRLAGGLDFVSSPPEQLARLPLRPETVVIVENVVTGLAFWDLPGTVLFYGHGNNLSFLSQIGWLRSAKRFFYWGDVDLAGFGILSEARNHLPQLVSVLMDRTTLLNHKALWAVDTSEPKAAVNLTPEEAALYRDLAENRLGERVRLEQEWIDWETAWSLFRRLSR